MISIQTDAVQTDVMEPAPSFTWTVILNMPDPAYRELHRRIEVYYTLAGWCDVTCRLTSKSTHREFLRYSQRPRTTVWVVLHDGTQRCVERVWSANTIGEARPMRSTELICLKDGWYLVVSKDTRETIEERWKRNTV